jgi:hypothetical protein
MIHSHDDLCASPVCENGVHSMRMMMILRLGRFLGKRYGELENLPVFINEGCEMLISVMSVHVWSLTEKL